MVTVRARSSALGICWVLLLVGCSREQQDWRFAERADTIEAYSRFIQRHPDSELIRQARTRMDQLGEERDWQQAGSADTVEAYRDFIQQHPNGRWAQEARIRVDNFSLNEQGRAAVAGGTGAGSAGVASAPGGGWSPVTGAAASTSILGAPSAAVPGPPVSGTPGSAVGNAPGATLGSVGVAPASGAATSTTNAPTGVPSAALTDSSSVGSAAGTGSAQLGTTLSPAPDTEPPSPPIAQSSPAMPATPSAPAVPAAPGGGFGIQLGAFASEAAATAQWQALAAHFGPELQGLQEHVVSAETPSGHVYRLQASVSTEAQARVICESLRRQAQGCVAVLPH